MRKLNIGLVAWCFLAVSPAVFAGDWVRLGPDIGTVTALAAHPTDPGIALAGTRYGGIFRTTDGGDSWTYVGLRGYEVTVIEFSVSDPAFVYSGLGWGYGNRVSGGVYVSHDVGLSWSAARAGLENSTYPPESQYFRFHFVGDLAIDSTDPSIVWAIGPSGARSDLFRTIDGGISWIPVRVPGTRQPRSIRTTSTVPSEVFVGLPKHGVQASRDGGSSWYDASTGLEYQNSHGEVNAHVPYFMVEMSWRPGGLIAQVDDGAPFFFDPDVGVWSRRPWGELPHRGAFWDRWVKDIAVGPPGSLDVWLGTGWNGIIHSGDGGQSWTYTESAGIECAWSWGGDWESYLHIPEIAVFAGEGDRLLARTERGALKRSLDRGESWHSVEQGLTNCAIHSFVVDPARPQKMAVATFGQGLLYSEDGGGTWWEVLSHDLHPCSNESPIPWNQPLPNCWGWKGVWSANDGKLRVRGECGTFTSSNSGATWCESDGPVRWPLGHSQNRQILFETTGEEVFKSTDSGLSWQECGELPTVSAYGEVIRWASVHDSTPDVVLAARGIGLFRSEDGCQSWQQTGESVTDCSSYNKWIGNDPWYPGSYFASNSCGLWESTDDALTWELIGFEGAGPNELLFDPERQGVIYVGTEDDGIRMSVDGGRLWLPLGIALQGRSVRNLTLYADGSVLFVSVDSDGLYRLDLQPWMFNRNAVEVFEVE